MCICVYTFVCEWRCAQAIACGWRQEDEPHKSSLSPPGWDRVSCFLPLCYGRGVGLWATGESPVSTLPFPCRSTGITYMHRTASGFLPGLRGFELRSSRLCGKQLHPHEASLQFPIDELLVLSQIANLIQEIAGSTWNSGRFVTMYEVKYWVSVKGHVACKTQKS